MTNGVWTVGSTPRLRALSSGQAVEAARVRPEQLLFHVLVDVRPLGERRQVAGEALARPLVREVARPEQHVRAKALDRQRQRPLLDLDREVDVAVRHVLARALA